MKEQSVPIVKAMDSQSATFVKEKRWFRYTLICTNHGAFRMVGYYWHYPSCNSIILLQLGFFFNWG